MFDFGSGVLEGSTEQAEVWLTELAHELGGVEPLRARRVQKAVLHAIRDGLCVEQAAAVGAPLPTLIRGLHSEDWEPASTPLPLHDLDAFLGRVAEDAQLAGKAEASAAVAAVMRVCCSGTRPRARARARCRSCRSSSGSF